MSDSDKSLPTEYWKKALLPVDATLQQAISNLNETAFQIAMIVTTDNILAGTLTDGDIRRGLLRDWAWIVRLIQLFFGIP